MTGWTVDGGEKGYQAGAPALPACLKGQRDWRPPSGEITGHEHLAGCCNTGVTAAQAGLSLLGYHTWCVPCWGQT